MRTPTLIKNGFRAMVLPHKVFKEIKPDDRLNYKVFIPLMVFCGIARQILHLMFVHGYFPMGLEALTLLLASIYGIAIWLVGSAVFHLLATIFKKDVRFQSIEIAVFYIFMIIVAMPLLDFPHLFGMEKGEYFLFQRISGTLHFSKIPACILMVIEAFFLLKCLLKFKGVIAFPLALLLPPAGKAFVSTMGIPGILRNIFGLDPHAWEAELISRISFLLVALCLAILYRRHIIKKETKADRLPTKKHRKNIKKN